MRITLGKLIAFFLLLLIPIAPASATRFVIWGTATGDDAKGQDAMIAAFERRHPGVRVVALNMGAGAMNPQKLMTAIVGGVPPDLIIQDRFTIGDWASRGAFRSLDDLLSADGRRSDPLAVHQSNYVQATWQEAVYQGHVYGIPYTTDDRVLYYNKSDFRDAGLDPNRPPQTWDELIADAKKLTVRTSTGYRRIGFIPDYGQGWLYLWAWQNDGEAMSAEGRRCTLANPATTQALGTMVNWYDALGGVDAISGYASGFGADEQDPFMTGDLAMKVEGNGFLQAIARIHPEMDFGVCPVPVPAARLHHEGQFKNDSTWVTWSGGSAFAIPIGSRHPLLAWQFIEWMNSPEANVIGANAQLAFARSKGRLFLPGFSADNRVTKALFDKYTPGLPSKFTSALQTCMTLLPVTRFRPVTFVGQRLWDEQVRAVDAAVRHTKTPAIALADAQRRDQIELDSADTVRRHPLLPRRTLLTWAAIGTGLISLALFVAVVVWMRRVRRATRQEALAGFAFIIPWVIGFLVFTLGPMAASLILSFCDYDVLHPARYAGFANYRDLVTLDRIVFAKSMGNALYLAAVGIPLGMITSLSMALLLNANVRGQKLYRTCFYVPSIVPTVATAVLWGWMLNADPSRGLVNAAWYATLTHWFHVAPPGWLAVPAWAKPGLILIGLWGAGGGMIMWLAGLKSIPASLYEAAAIDGAGPLSQFRHITLPMLSPYIFFSLIMSTIGALQTFETAYILGGTSGGETTGPDDSLLVPVVYLFNNAFQYFKMGYASALAWILFIIILGLTLGQIKLAPRWVHYENENA
jgi:multiple sugar transport system permease protein